MNSAPPVLLLGFNRPHKMKQLVNSLRVNRPPLVLVAVDGPRAGSRSDDELVLETQSAVEHIDWQSKVIVRFRQENMGLKNAVTDAVSWATSEYGSVIVLEDDCVPGPYFLPFATQMLDKFKNREDIAHINGYNLVDKYLLSQPTSSARLTRYPESYAWATWERAWSVYDDDLTWARSCSINELREITGSYWAAARWKINFADAASERINTWAYRWLASMWSNNLSIIAPNRNLVRYDGHDDGTHIRRLARWKELELGNPFEEDNDLPDGEALQDEVADRWIGRNVFRENFLGTCEGIAASVAMGAIQKYSQIKERNQAIR